MDKIKGFFSSPHSVLTDSAGDTNGADSAERGVIAEALDASTLSWSTRIQGFGACFVLGVCISLLGCIMFALNPLNLSTFAILYTLGNILAISSTLFLMGPMKQIKNMFSSSRWMATTGMLVFLLLTLLSAFWWQKKGLTILFCVMQFCAMTWYCLSYIPYARDMAKKFFDSILS